MLNWYYINSWLVMFLGIIPCYVKAALMVFLVMSFGGFMSEVRIKQVPRKKYAQYIITEVFYESFSSTRNVQ